MFGKIKSIYRRFFWSYEKRARVAGVEMGSNNFIATSFWSSEPYLIKIGSFCQITAGVKIFTHGGDKLLDISIQILMHLVRSYWETMYTLATMF